MMAALNTTQSDEMVTVVARVPKEVAIAMKLEAARRNAKGEKLHQKDIHREWLVAQAAVVLEGV